MRQHVARGTVTVAATALVLLAVSGVGYAFWTTTGAGTGSATATDFTPPTITVGTASAGLYPGFAGGTLQVMVTNPNPFPITVTLSRDAAKPVTSDTAGCTDEGALPANVTGVSYASGSFTVAASTTTPVSRSTAGVAMSTASVSACQGATFTIPVSSSSVSG